jgi:hypothetical protein
MHFIYGDDRRTKIFGAVIMVHEVLLYRYKEPHFCCPSVFFAVYMAATGALETPPYA